MTMAGLTVVKKKTIHPVRLNSFTGLPEKSVPTASLGVYLLLYSVL